MWGHARAAAPCSAIAATSHAEAKPLQLRRPRLAPWSLTERPLLLQAVLPFPHPQTLTLLAASKQELDQRDAAAPPIPAPITLQPLRHPTAATASVAQKTLRVVLAVRVRTPPPTSERDGDQLDVWVVRHLVPTERKLPL